MKLKIFSVYDSKVNAYMTPFFMKSKGQAIRSFDELTNDPSTQINKWPADFTLMELGEYDDSNGSFQTLPVPTSCGTALEFKKEIQHRMSQPETTDARLNQ